MKSTEEFDSKNESIEANDEIEISNQKEGLNQTGVLNQAEISNQTGILNQAGVLNQTGILNQAEKTKPNNKTDDSDFDVLKRNFPEFQSMEDVPKEAAQISEKENIPIFDAYLRYLFYQNKRIEEEQKNREKNSMKTVGSLKSADNDYGMSYINAMLKAIRN